MSFHQALELPTNPQSPTSNHVFLQRGLDLKAKRE
jgi:hypothetical protein